MVGSLWLTLFRVRDAVDDLRPAGVYGAAFVSYEEGSPLTYHELLVARPLSTDAYGRRVTITDIWVDSPASVAGGRELWAIPKGLCDFTFESSHTGPLTTTEWTAGLGRTPIATARFRDVSRAALRLPFKGGTWQPGHRGHRRRGAHRDPARVVEGAPGPGALGHQPGRPARLAGRRPPARVVPPGGVPDVVRLRSAGALRTPDHDRDTTITVLSPVRPRACWNASGDRSRGKWSLTRSSRSMPVVARSIASAYVPFIRRTIANVSPLRRAAAAGKEDFARRRDAAKRHPAAGTRACDGGRDRVVRTRHLDGDVHATTRRQGHQLVRDRLRRPSRVRAVARRGLAPVLEWFAHEDA